MRRATSTSRADLGTDVRKEMMNDLEALGIKVETAHHEVAIGQHEIDFKYADALRTADNAVTFKTTLKAARQPPWAARDLHAQAVLRDQRLGHAHAIRACGTTARRVRTPSPMPRIRTGCRPWPSTTSPGRSSTPGA